ncbi:CocE/NonD family hydrolase [Salinarimonas rosea]|uniref:CocE/NonD family hydrolase n=1 Tax=Salinarimonas rosea TaxID=552063 RepID=UPI0003F60144|nr:CocE/NonD family hydrolase [Salinarimonas rosea]
MDARTPETHGTAGDVVVLSDVMVPMRDGVRLSTDVTLPARDGVQLPGPHPTLLHRTPYGKAEARLSEISVADPVPRPNGLIAADLARAGYAVVMQDCRGRYGSEGVFRKYLGEGEDGVDTLAWIGAQPWSDGRIGTFGLSYSAHVQTALAALRPPGLAAMFLDSGGFWNAYQGGVRKGGAFELKQATWAFKHARLSPAAMADPVVAAALDAEDIAAWFAALPWKRGHSPLRYVPEYEDYLFEQWERGAFDGFWRRPELHAADHYDAIARVPTFLICGWYDPYAETICEHFRGITAAGGRAEIVMGPWLHGRRSQTHAGDVDFGEGSTLDAAIAADYASLRRAWFDRWMGPRPARGASPPAARWFCMGGGSGRRDANGRRAHGGAWREAASFPPPDAVETPFFLDARGLLAADPAPEGAITIQTDPADPVPSLGGAITSGAPIMEGGAYDQVPGPETFGARAPFLPLAARRDVLVFATPPLAHDLEIAGPVRVHLRLSTDAPDIDVTIKLVDWAPPSADYPQGFAMNLTDGILRLRYRRSFAEPRLMAPGEVADIVVTAPPVANLFRAGHRIRLDIAGSSFPRFDVNPQTGEPEGRALGRRIATTTFHLGGASSPPRLVLSVAS